ncbi:MAG: hypothetical protein ABL877_09940 [Thiobacillus sp.]
MLLIKPWSVPLLSPLNQTRIGFAFLQQQVERIGQLPMAKQRFVMEMLETVLAQASR